MEDLQSLITLNVTGACDVLDVSATGYEGVIWDGGKAHHRDREKQWVPLRKSLFLLLECDAAVFPQLVEWIVGFASDEARGRTAFEALFTYWKKVEM